MFVLHDNHRKTYVALIFTVVLFLDRLDLTIVNVTLPALGQYFHLFINQTRWVSLSFLLALALSIPASKWLGERFGAKNIYLVAMAIFGIAATVCAWAPTFDMLVICRFVHGIGGGILIPTGMTMVYRAYRREEYASMTSWIFLPTLIAPALAPFIGGLLLDHIGWRVVFLLSGPICLILLPFAWWLLGDDHQRLRQPFDGFGFILGAVILMGTFYGLSLIEGHGFTRQVGMLAILVLAAIGALIQIEGKRQYPLFAFTLFKVQSFSKAVWLQLCFQICHFGAIFLLGMYLQIGIGLSATLSGLIMGMQAIGAMLTSRVSVWLYQGYSDKVPVVIGLIGVILFTEALFIVQRPDDWVAGMVIFFVRGLFSGLCGTPIQTLCVCDMDSIQLPSANSLFIALRQVSISIGIALSSVFLVYGLHHAGIMDTSMILPNQLMQIFVPGMLFILLVGSCGVMIAVFKPSSQLGIPASEPMS